MSALALTKAQLAEALAISESTISRLVRAGQLPQPRRLGGSPRWVASEVEAALLQLQPGADSGRTAAARAARRAA